MKKVVLIICIFLSLKLPAQLDFLKLALKNAKHDTTRCNILSAMVEAEEDDAIWIEYNNQLKTISEKISPTLLYPLL